MGKVIDTLKILLLHIVFFLLKVFWIFPVKNNRILFMAFEGEQFSCNPKAVFEYMYQKYKNDYEFIWCLNNPKKFLSEHPDVKTVKYLSLKFIFYIMTSGAHITNDCLVPFIPKRKNQIFINTWHGGGAYKKIKPPAGKPEGYNIYTNIRAKITDGLVSSCKSYTDYYSEIWESDKSRFYDYGTPRNDMLIFKDSYSEKAKKIKDSLEISDDVKIVLYAPTFRGYHNSPDNFDMSLDIERLVYALNEKFSDNFIFLFRAHHLFRIGEQKLNVVTKDVSDYEDMQDLLLISDVLVTDYSSSMWDFSFTNRPCFLFTPDLDEYKNENGFITPIEEWPFPIALTNEELVSNIKNFDSKSYSEKVEQHHKSLGSFETGKATESIVKIISEFCKA